MEALEAVEVAIEATDDAAAPVLVQLARAEALHALGDDAGAALAQEEADRRAEVLDLDPAPWQLAFRLVAGGDAEPMAERLLAGRPALTERARPASGLIVGRFCPPHLGHSHLITSAAAQVDRLVVFVNTRDGEVVPGELRAQWLADLHPEVSVVEVRHDLDTDFGDEELWRRWISLFRARWPEELGGRGPGGRVLVGPVRRRTGAAPRRRVRGRRCRPRHRAHLGHSHPRAAGRAPRLPRAAGPGLGRANWL